MSEKERKYENFVKEVSFDEFNEKVKNGELNINANYDEVFVFNLIPGDIDDMVDTFIGMMDEAKAILSVEIDPESLFNNMQLKIILTFMIWYLNLNLEK